MIKLLLLEYGIISRDRNKFSYKGNTCDMESFVTKQDKFLETRPGFV